MRCCWRLLGILVCLSVTSARLDADDAAQHWAYRAIKAPPVPDVRDAGRVRTDVDRFVQAELEASGLSLGAEAERATLIRRVAFDLTGLPPTSTELAAFLADPAPGAYERMVERYLASPHYGERWGKIWLDAAGYADSNGYFHADSDRPLAYKYRDYVVRSFNADKPFDRFVQEQLAGDELAGYTPGGDVTPEMAELLVATHFLRNAQDGTGESDGNPDELRVDRFSVLEGTLQITMSSLLGITIQCARCHEHKFEPITHEEYYGLQAIFFAAYSPERWRKPNERVLTVGTRAEREEHARRNQAIDVQVQALRESLRTAAVPLRRQLVEERLKDVEAGVREAVLAAWATEEEKRSDEQRALVKAHEAALKVGDDDLAKRFPEFAALRDNVEKAIASRDAERPAPLETIAVLVENDPEPLVHHVLLRGMRNRPGPEVAPGVPAALTTPENVYRVPKRSEGSRTSGRRTAFARWVTSPANPLFARVQVNRIWQYHFGKGLVATPGNFGRSGARPSHPELLDYLASTFIANGWSVKEMHRLIMRSAVYRQSSALRDDAYEIDPDDRLLWRWPARRLDAEAIRDSMLAVSGELDPTLGGPYVATERLGDGQVVVKEEQAGAKRRSIYLQQRRSKVLTVLELFDAPSMVVNCPQRSNSTIPLQSLALMNSDFARARAEGFARRLRQETDDGTAGQASSGTRSAEERVSLAFLFTLGRGPTAEERAAAERFLKQQQTAYADAEDAEERVWGDFCQMIFASNAFLYVE